MKILIYYGRDIFYLDREREMKSFFEDSMCGGVELE